MYSGLPPKADLPKSAYLNEYTPLISGGTWVLPAKLTGTQTTASNQSTHEASIYRKCTGRQTLPTKPFNEAWVISAQERLGGSSRKTPQQLA
jgi:hypothetical protein